MINPGIHTFLLCRVAPIAVINPLPNMNIISNALYFSNAFIPTPPPTRGAQ